MRSKAIATALLFVLLLNMFSTSASAADKLTSVLPPIHLGVADESGSVVLVTVSMQDDLKPLVANSKADIWVQCDFKIDKKDWHHTPAWNASATFEKFTIKWYSSLLRDDEEFSIFIGTGKLDFSMMAPEDKSLPTEYFVPSSWAWYKNHSITFRARFVVRYEGEVPIFSPWSSEYTLSDSKNLDYKKILIDNPPVLESVILKANESGWPYMSLQLGKPSDEIQQLNAAAGGRVCIAVWCRIKGEKVFKMAERYLCTPFVSNEKFWIFAGDFDFKIADDMSTEAYEVKVQYWIEESAYRQSGVDDFHYLVEGSFSNTLSTNMPAWTTASGWAEPELKKALDLGLFPETLTAIDLTQPITRAEFAAVAVKVYEALGGTQITPAATNPFVDTHDADVLKTYHANIMMGTSAGRFSPDVPLTREQAATALARAYKRALIPGWTLAADDSDSLDFTQPAKFSDDAQISDWAKSSVYFMTANGVVKGTRPDTFNPKGGATCEQALVMGFRMVENLRTGQISGT